MDPMDSIYEEAKRDGYSLDRQEFLGLYEYAKSVQIEQQRDYYQLYSRAPSIDYSASFVISNATSNASWLKNLHRRIEAELGGKPKFPQFESIKAERKDLLERIRKRRTQPPKPVLLDLPEEATDLIRQATSSPGSTVIERFAIPITGRDLKTLSGCSWLNDEIINFYFELIAERSAKRIHIFNTFFYPKLKDSGYAVVRRWSRKADIFSMDRVLLPIHLGNHWCCAEISMPERTIYYYDSLHGTNPLCLKLLKEYLESEHADKKGCPLPDSGDWKLCAPTDRIPPQQNGYDCGVFTCVMAEYRSRGAEFTFSQADMPYFRRRLAYEIITGRLLE